MVSQFLLGCSVSNPVSHVFEPILAQARNLIHCALTPGDTAVDGTVGNGHDTLFLAECVGPTGRVVGFDRVITVVLYPGHEGGRAETEAVLSWARTVPAHRALVACHQVLNTRKTGPLLLAIAKRS